jgi:hypothetical protein
MYSEYLLFFSSNVVANHLPHGYMFCDFARKIDILGQPLTENLHEN